MFNELEIIPARKQDVDEIVTMVRELAEYEKLLEDCRLTKSLLKRALFEEPKSARALIAFYQGEPAGTAIYFFNFSTFEGKKGLYLEDLYVRPHFRKKGIGGALLRELAKIAKQEDCARMEWSVLEWNELAKSQYRKIGAKPMDEWRVWRITGPDLENLALGTVPSEKLKNPSEKSQTVPLTSANQVEVYTDGGCQPNPGIGGWAVVIRDGERHHELSGGELETTNNRMELMAVIMALESMPPDTKASLIVDSAYVKNGVNQWMKKWKKNGWMTASGTAVKNQDLWMRLDLALQNHHVAWKWVKGHSGNIWNDRCDTLCTEEINKQKNR